MAMYRSILVSFYAVSALLLVVQVKADLTLDKKCGQKVCSEEQYCSKFDSFCRPCQEVCESSSHNYQAQICQDQCQEYLHDKRFLKRDEQPASDIEGRVQQIYMLVVSSLVVLLLVLAACLAVLTLVCLKLKGRHNVFPSLKIQEKMAAFKTPANNNKENGDVENQKVSYRPEMLKLEIPPGQVQSPPPSTACHNPVTPATTSTPLSKPRHPSEDTTLEYAYDNPALTPSPVFDKNQQPVVTKRESSF